MTARIVARIALRLVLFSTLMLMADRVIAGIVQCRALGILPTGLSPW
jgi:hypothetical protein